MSKGKYQLDDQLVVISNLYLSYTQFVEALGQQPMVYHILKTPQAMLAIPNSTDHTFYTVSNASAICTTLGIFTFGWEGHLLIYNSATLSLYYLGEYAGGAGHKVTPDEYKTLPKEVSFFLPRLGRGVNVMGDMFRPRCIFSTQQNC